MSSNNPRDTEQGKEIKLSPPHHWILATLIFLLVLGYTIAVISGNIKGAEKIDAVDLGLIALGALLIVALINPQVLQRIRIFELGSLKFELQEVRVEQAAQKDALDEITTILGILLPEKEQNHLVYLLKNKTANYAGGNPMRTELRHLRSIGLIDMQHDKDGRKYTIGEMHSDMHFDLSDYVELTDLGRKSAKLISEARKAAQEEEARKAAAEAGRAKEEEEKKGRTADTPKLP